ncbi:MAG: DUF2236 domain-containing protein [Moraxellaceae bacterium]|nr:MAG: DUF2236 domain-containing protein [Moraxellaceae bacterium]
MLPISPDPITPIHARAVPTRARLFKQRQYHAVLTKTASKFIGHSIAPSEPRTQALLDGLWQGDPLMDNVVAWICETDSKARKQQFDQALQHGLTSIEHCVDGCPSALYELFSVIETTPEWLDPQQLEMAQQFMQAVGLNANYILKDMALMGGYLLSGFNQALVMTGALNKNASQRLAETSKWWMDCTAINGLERFSQGFKTTLHVRLIHALVRRNLQQKQQWQAEQWGLPICQIDMAATNLAFCSLFLLGLRGLGIFPTSSESKAVMHFWKYMGWLMGVDEQWLPDTEVEGLVLLYQTMLTQSPPDWTSQALGKSLAEEPLSKHYKYFQPLKRQWEYQKRLSISQYFLGKHKLQLLGVEKTIWPWYPLLLVPKNLVLANIPRHVPGIKQRWQRHQRRQQQRYQQGFGTAGKNIIQPSKQHPAYIGE